MKQQIEAPSLGQEFFTQTMKILESTHLNLLIYVIKTLHQHLIKLYENGFFPKPLHFENNNNSSSPSLTKCQVPHILSPFISHAFEFPSIQSFPYSMPSILLSHHYCYMWDFPSSCGDVVSSSNIFGWIWIRLMTCFFSPIILYLVLGIFVVATGVSLLFLSRAPCRPVLILSTPSQAVFASLGILSTPLSLFQGEVFGSAIHLN